MMREGFTVKPSRKRTVETGAFETGHCYLIYHFCLILNWVKCQKQIKKKAKTY